MTSEPDPAKKRKRRTSEQLAADYQARANRARARANAEARSLETRAKLFLADSILDLVSDARREDGGAGQLAFFDQVIRHRLSPEQWETFERWWHTRGHPEN